jgi:hypothetical protein
VVSVNVDIGTLDIGQGLEFNLQFLRNVMCSTERVRSAHDNVDFDENTGAGGVGANGIDGSNERGVGYGCGNC